MVTSDLNIDSKQNLGLNFRTVNDTFTADEVLTAYTKGKDSVENQIKKQIFNGLEVSSVSSSYLWEKLKSLSIEIIDMYLRISDVDEFDSLVVLKDKDFYNKEKRWKAYEIAQELNSGIKQLDIKYSFMPMSEYIDVNLIFSEGFVFKYDKEENKSKGSRRP